MAAVKNVMETVRSQRGIINPKYDMTIKNIDVIREQSRDTCDMICNSFCFGYIHGLKAAKAEMRKKLQAQQG